VDGAGNHGLSGETEDTWKYSGSNKKYSISKLQSLIQAIKMGGA